MGFQLKKNILLFEYLIDITDPDRLLIRELEKSEFKKTRTFDFRGVGFIHEYKYVSRK